MHDSEQWEMRTVCEEFGKRDLSAGEDDSLTK